MKRLTFLVLVFVVQFALAQIPQTLNYQGVLTDLSGKAVTDSTYTIVFKLYEAFPHFPVLL